MKKLLLFFAVYLVSNLTFSQIKTQWRGENRDGIYNETGLLKQWPAEGPNLLWHFDELGDGHASAAVTEDAIYTSGTVNGIGFVVAIDHTGKLIWKTEYGKEWIESWEGVRTTPLIDGDKLYFMSAYGVIYCMNPKNGEKVWEIDLFEKYGGVNIQWGVTENLTIHNDKLLCTVGGPEHNVVAINKVSGELIWTSKANGELSAYCSPTVIKHSNLHILVTQTANSVLGINVETGEFLWSHEWTNKYAVHANTALYHEGQIFIVSGYGKGGIMLKLSDDGKSITKLWTNADINHKSGGFVRLNNRIYGAVDRGMEWHCIDWKTGKTLYTSSVFKSGNIISAEGLLYMYSEGGEIALVEPLDDNFNILGRFKVPYGEKHHWAHLVIHNKRLYVRHGSSLMVYSIGN